MKRDNTKIKIDGFTFDLSECPHILIGGCTGSGKSNLLHYIVNQLTIPLFIVDPKFTEFNKWSTYEDITVYNNLSDIEKFVDMLHSITFDRLRKLQACGCKDIDEYNRNNENKMQRCAVIIDEFHLVLKGRITKKLSEVVTISRAVGVHFIFATQKPTAQNTNSIITSQCNARISLQVATATDSRVILGTSGAEKLKNKGDLILKYFNGYHTLHCPYFKF